jgi:hypothetical protein
MFYDSSHFTDAYISAFPKYVVHDYVLGSVLSSLYSPEADKASE